MKRGLLSHVHFPLTILWDLRCLLWGKNKFQSRLQMSHWGRLCSWSTHGVLLEIPVYLLEVMEVDEESKWKPVRWLQIQGRILRNKTNNFKICEWKSIIIFVPRIVLNYRSQCITFTSLCKYWNLESVLYN